MTIQHDDTTPCLRHSRLLKRGVIGWRNSLMLRPVPTDSNTSFSPVRLRYISVRVPSRSETVIRWTPPSCLTNPAPRLLTVENRFAGLSAKIDRVIDRRPFNFVSSVHLCPLNRGLNNQWKLVRRIEVHDVSDRNYPRNGERINSFMRDFIILREDKIVFAFWLVGIKYFLF